MYKAVHFNKLIPGVVKIDKYGGVRVKLYSESMGDIRGKIAYLPLDAATKEPRDIIGEKDNSFDVWPKTGKTLYVTKESHVPRALLRNSDYKITIIRENADYVIVPAPQENEIAKRRCNVAYIIYGKETRLYYFEVNYTWRDDCDEVDEDDVPKIYEAIKENIKPLEDETYDFHHLVLLDLKAFDIYFVKKCEEIEDVLTGKIYDEVEKKDKYKIVLDTKLRIDSTNEITADMLQIWEKMDNNQMIAKSIIGSNWQQYPCTISVFIDYKNLRYYGGEQMNYILDSIDFDYYHYNDAFRPNREIQPDDWNLLQDWLMLKSEMPKEGGFKIQRGKGLAKFAHYAECFKPCKISEPTLYQEIEARLNV